MKTTMKILAAAVAVAAISGCSRDADVASRNLSVAADQFELQRRIVFYNGITGGYMLSIEGKCSIDNGLTARSVAVTCKTGPAEYKKHLLGLSDNVTFFMEQLEPVAVSAYRYRVIFKPEAIIPSIDLTTSAGK